MRVAIVAFALVLPLPARAGDAVLQTRLGILGAESGALSRSPMVEMLVGGSWRFLEPWGVALSYRGAAKSAGGGGVAMVSTVHRFQMGPQFEQRFERWLLGCEVGAHYRIATAQLSGNGVSDPLRTRQGIGAGADAWAGLRLTPTLAPTFILSGYSRYGRIDLVAALGLNVAL